MNDFDYWMELHKTNPERFNQEREEMAKNFISSVPLNNQFALTGLQVKINRVVRTSGTPINACITISHLMWDSFNELNEKHIELLDEVKENYIGDQNAN